MLASSLLSAPVFAVTLSRQNSTVGGRMASLNIRLRLQGEAPTTEIVAVDFRPNLNSNQMNALAHFRPSEWIDYASQGQDAFILDRIIPWEMQPGHCP